MTKARDIAIAAAAPCACGGFRRGVRADALDKLGRVGERETIVDEGGVHGAPYKGLAISRLPTNVVNGAFTMLKSLDPPVSK